MSIPFESSTRQRLARYRRDDRAQSTFVVGGYLDAAHQPRAVRGTEVAPYGIALGRASLLGDTDQPFLPSGVQGKAVATGEEQVLLTDEWGRLWTRAASSEPLPVLSRYTTPGAAPETVAVVSAAPPAGQIIRLRWVGVAMDGGAAAGMALHVFDSPVAPKAGDSPVWRDVMLDAGAGFFNNVNVEFEAAGGLVLTTGASVAISSTLGVLTPPQLTGFFQALFTVETP